MPSSIDPTNCVAFLAEQNGQSGDRRLCGTGFFVAIPGAHNFVIPYFVTARHVVDAILQNIELVPHPYIRANQVLNGVVSARWIATNAANWHNHPDSNIDVAILQLDGTPNTLDHSFIPLSQFCTDIFPSGRTLEVGTEIRFPGLFDRHDGVSRNVPVLRIGTLAAIPHEKIKVTDRYAKTREAHYLIAEMRSLGGLSGSPAFAHIPSGLYLQPPDPHDLEAWTSRMSSFQIRLIGMVSGHWDASFLKTQQGSAVPVRKEYDDVNTGLGFVTPIKSIIETLNQPHVLAKRQEMLKAINNLPSERLEAQTAKQTFATLDCDLFEHEPPPH